jgi:UDP-3-O-[3-hydroxymyristoyl] glucosamine N-acyltransferase
MSTTLGDIARALGSSVEGDPSLLIDNVRGVEQAGAAEIAVVWDPRHYGSLHKSLAGALVIPHDCSVARQNVIRVADPKLALGIVIRMFMTSDAPRTGIEPGAHVAATARTGERVFIAAGAYVGEHAVLGDDVRIHAHAVIGDGSVVGDGTEIHPNVTIYPRTRIGRRVVIHAGTVIGSDGFGYAQWRDAIDKIPQIGIVEIEDDVEIGANCTIDRATLEITRIGAGTKIDNLVQVGHNSNIGRNVLLVAQVGISGSVTVGDGAILGGQVGVADHVTVGPAAKVGAQAGVHSSIPTGEWLGSPAIPRERAGRMFAALPHVPDYRERVRTLESKVAELETLLAQLREKSELADTKAK